MAYDVFISHASRDQAVAAAVADRLETEGIRCWVAPRDILPGVQWSAAISDAISASSLVVLVFSASANASPTVVREVERAVYHGKTVIPVRIEDVAPSKALEYFVSSAHWLDALTPPLEHHFDRLAGVVRQVLGRSRGEPPTIPEIAVVPEVFTPPAKQRLQRLAQAVMQVLRISPMERPAISGLPAEDVLLQWLASRSASEIAEALHRLDFRPDLSELPPEVAAVIPLFRQCGRFAEQYLALENPFRRREALESALRELATAQARLLDHSSAMGAGRLLEVASVWRSVLERERSTVETAIEEARDIPNPFVYGNPVVDTSGNLFAGRRDIVRQIEQSILGAGHAPTLLLYGQRRMGKTSILVQLPQLLGPGFLPIIIDCQNPAALEGPAAMLRFLSRAIANAVRQRVTELDPKISIEPIAPELLQKEPYCVFDEWLDQVETSLPSGLRPMLCIDEYERLQAAVDAGWGSLFLDSLRHLLQHRQRFVTMFTGSHTFEELGPTWTDRFISARRVRVSFLSIDEVRPLLTKPVPDFSMTYAPGALEALYLLTNGQPFLTQAVAFELVQLLNEQHRKEATPSDVETAGDGALERGGEYFANLWSSIGGSRQEYLLVLASGQTPSASPADEAWLRGHDILNAHGTFAVPLVEKWVARRPMNSFRDEDRGREPRHARSVRD